ncbi:MAG: DNA polymerase III subunit beta [Planctomycetes bacterium]|nr:DNA polymerase III subunit beta [Planctomycetota bacterium]
MEFSCDREKMLSVFQTAAAVVPARSPKSILQNVKFAAEGPNIVVMATDLDISVRVVLEGADVRSEGVVIVPVDPFGSILRESSDANMHVVATESGTSVRGDRSRFQIPARNPDEYPVIEDTPWEAYHEIPARVLRELIHRTTFATDVESTRYALGGVLIEFDAERMTAVGTDGRRLAKMEAIANSVGGHRGGAAATIVPTRAMQIIERSLVEMDTPVHLAAFDNSLGVRIGNTRIVSRLVEGRYPRWRDVFPKRTAATRIDLIVGPLLANVRQAAIFNDKDSRGLEFSFDAGRVKIAAAATNLGSSEIEYPLAYDGPPISVVLDNRYVIDFLRVLSPQQAIQLELEGPQGAALFTTDDGYSYVVMPLSRDR